MSSEFKFMRRSLFGLAIFNIVLVWTGCDRPKSQELANSSIPGPGKNPPSLQTNLENAPATESDEGSVADAGVIDSSLRQAEQAFVGQRWDECERILRNLLLKRPDASRALFLMAQVKAQGGDLAAAVGTLADIPETDPDFGTAAAGQSAQWLAEMGKVGPALESYERALRLSPSLKLLRRQYAKYLNFMGLRYRARNVLGPLVDQRDLNEQELRALVDVSTSFSKSQETAGESPGVAESPFSEALGWLRNRQPREAIILLEAFVEQGFSAELPLVHATLAAAKAELQQFDEAIEIIKTTPGPIKNNPFYWRTLGDYAMSQNQAERAVAVYWKSFELDTTSPVAHERLMSALLASGRELEARSIDERQAALYHAQTAVKSIHADGSLNVKEARRLLENLETIGYSKIAMAWSQWIQTKWPQDEAAANLTAPFIQRQRDTPIELIAFRRNAGIDPAKLLKFRPNQVASTMLNTASVAKPSVHKGPHEELRFDPVPTPAHFVNVAQELGVRHRYLTAKQPRKKNFQIYQTLGTGAAAFDFDRDGRVDIYLGQGGCDPPNGKSDHSNQLYRNEAPRFLPVAEVSGCVDLNYTQGVTAGDINQDGFADLVVGNFGTNRLLINNGDGTFSDASQSIGWLSPTRQNLTTCVAIADVSGDGLSDIVEVNYVNSPSMHDPLPVGPDGTLLQIPAPLMYTAEIDRVWVGTSGGGLSFEEVLLGNPEEDWGRNASAAIGDAANPGLGLLISNFDDRDGLDIFIANDMRPNQLWQQSNSGSPLKLEEVREFHDVAVAKGCAVSSRGETNACMGVAFGDFDRNERPDIFVTNYADEWVNLYLMNRGGTFQDSAPRFQLDRLSENFLGFGAQAIDYNHDGWLDLFVLNGHLDSLPNEESAFAMSSQLLLNLGERFEEASQIDSAYWDAKHLGRCAITLDHNQDGRLDLLAVDLLDEVALLENRTDTVHGWLQVELAGVASPRDAIGAKVTVQQQGRVLHQWVATGDGYHGKNECVAEFGLGNDLTPVEVKVSWPSGATATYPNVAVQQRYLCIENDQAIWAR